MVAALLRRLHCGHVEVGAHAVRDERLGAVYDVLSVFSARERPQARHVGPGRRLGDRQRPDLLALEPWDDPAPLLLLGPELENRRHRDPGVAADPGRHAARPAARHLLGEDGAVHGVSALAAVLLRVGETQEAELAHALEDPVRERLALPLLGVGLELLLDERADRLAQAVVLLGEDEVLLLRLEVGLQDLLGGGHVTASPPRSTTGRVNSSASYLLRWARASGARSARPRLSRCGRGSGRPPCPRRSSGSAG